VTFLLHAHKFPVDIHDFFASTWNKTSIWGLNLPIRNVPLSQLQWHLELPFWSTNPPEPLFNLSPNEVLSISSFDDIHWKRIHMADLSYPIDTAVFADKLVIIDGLHRLASAKYHDREDIQIRVVPPAHIKQIVVA
jgi:hypothetical protein